MITCVIPVKDLSLVADVDQMFERLNLTIKSIISQPEVFLETIVVHGPGFDTRRIEGGVRAVCYEGYDFDFLSKNFESQNDVVRYDKGMRVLEAVNSGYSGDYVFVVDWDDVVLSNFSRNIKNLITNDYSAIYIDGGLVFSDSSFVCKIYSGFSSMCGSTVLLSKDIVDRVRLGSENNFNPSAYFGSHVLVKNELKRLGFNVAYLKTLSVAYRVGYRGNTSGTGGMLRCYFSILRNRNLDYDVLRKIFSLSRKPDECK